MSHVLRLFERLLACESDDHTDGKVGIQAFHRAAASIGLELKDAADAFVRIASSARDDMGDCADEKSCSSIGSHQKWEKRRITVQDLEQFLDGSFAQHAELFRRLDAHVREIDLEVPNLESLSFDERTTFIGPLLSRRICVTEAMHSCDALKLKLSHIQKQLDEYTSEIHRLEDQSILQNEDNLPFFADCNGGLFLNSPLLDAAHEADVSCGPLATPCGASNGRIENIVQEACEHGIRSPLADGAVRETRDALNVSDPVQVMWGSLFENYSALKQLHEQTEKHRKHLTVLKTLTEDQHVARASQRSRNLKGSKPRSSQKPLNSAEASPLTKDVDKERVQDQICQVQAELNSSLSQLAAKKEEITILERQIAQKTISLQTWSSTQSNQILSGIQTCVPFKGKSSKRNQQQEHVRPRPLLSPNVSGAIDCLNSSGCGENGLVCPASSSTASVSRNNDMTTLDAALSGTLPRPHQSISASSVAQEVLERTRQMMDHPMSKTPAGPRLSARKKMSQPRMIANDKSSEQPMAAMDTAIRSAVDGALRTL